MDIITKETIKDLMLVSGHTLISIFMPTHRVGREMQQDPIRLRNLLTKAEGQLENRGLRKPDVEELINPGEALLLDSDFWQHQSDGLAIFLARENLRCYRLPIRIEELLIIADRFHIKPILPLLSRNGHFYVLALSQNQVRLLEGSLFSVDEINLEDVPTSLREALWFDDPERQLQFHTGTASPGIIGSRPSAFHGQGLSEEDKKKNLLRYFQKVDKGLMELIGDEQAPLVLAGVDYLLPIYRQANSYSYLIKTAIEGNPDELSAADLHRRAWEIVEPIFGADERQAIRRYQELSGSGSELASNSLKSIIPAVHYGRVDSLFVKLGEQQWGSFDASKNTLEQHQEFHPGDQDLLDLAAMETLLNGGSVYALHLDSMPDEASLSAIFRY